MNEIIIDSITKQFGSKKVLQGISLSFQTGKRYALLGENGAGKSTLSHIISGSLTADCGTISVQGSPVQFRTPHDAQAAGIAMVHQIPSLADHLTVLENIILGSEPRYSFGMLNRKAAVSRITTIMEQWHLSLDLKSKVADLTAGQRFHTALLAALYKNPWFLILDEPSANLSESERDTLYRTIAEETSRNDKALTVLFITHSIAEALANADETIILRRGIISGSWMKGDERATVDEITRAIFGDEKDMKKGIKPVEISVTGNRAENDDAETDDSTAPLFELDDCSLEPADFPNLYHLALTIPQGSFTAIAGLKESGLSTLENLLTGFCTTRHTGKISFLGIPCDYDSASIQHGITPSLLREHRIGIVSSDKIYRSSNPNLTVRDLLVSHWGRESDVLTAAGIKASLEDQVSSLSGGMLQKLILTRELAHNPRALILANPSYGLDAASVQALRQTLTDAVKAGITIVVLSVVKDSLYEVADYRWQLEAGVLTRDA